MASNSKLFQPLKVGSQELSNRIVMAPLTRFRADDNHVPMDMVADYYAQRASVPGTLLISEATYITSRAGGYPNIPGIQDSAQINAWKKVTDAVHAKGGIIYLQLWALGRTANADYLKSQNLDLVAPSALAMNDKAPTPRALTEDEIQSFIADYATAAKNAVHGAGFDGVEIHAANGYLIDQFTQDVSNKRTDKWGGSIENRSRFALEVSRAVADAVGADRTGIRLSPWSSFQGMKMADPIPQFSHLIRGLAELKLAYLHVVESRIAGNADIEATEKVDFAVEIWGKTSPVLIAGGFKAESARKLVDEEYKDADVGVVFGRYFISNPDLVFRVKEGIEFAKYDRDTFYNAKSEKGYTDYPFSEKFQEAKL
ncbi:hypothetical protein MBLNU457_4871t1 [Dothideomycetes sp. NU457]